MWDWKTFGFVVAFVLAWFALNRWVLPKFGINTCLTGCCSANLQRQAPDDVVEDEVSKSLPPKAQE